ncbi:MAG: ABC transporter substrate-binding protein [Deltaproteobacteria bacterium]|nr:ABC transporter substrate-binding protein [Deltaproteobacteria bacterium]
MLGEKLRIAPTCYHVLHLIPVMVAHEMNFFSDEGLRGEDGLPNYEIIRDSMVPFGLEKLGISQAMKEKSVDIALDVQTRTVFFQRSRGADLYIIAGWRNQHIHVWIGTPEIKSLAELKGKRIGINDIGDNQHWAISTWIRKAGLDPDRDVHWVRGIFHPLHIEALRSGKVDCVAVLVWEAERLKKERFNPLVTLQQQYPNGRPERIIAATGRILEERPAMVKGFLKGMIRAYWFMRDPDRNYNYIYNLEKRLRQQSPDAEERTMKFTFHSPLRMEGMPFPIDGLPTGFEDLLREEKAAGDLNYDVPAIEDVCALDLVKEAFNELKERKELKGDLERASAVAERYGY